MFYARSLLLSGFFIIVHVIAHFLASCSPYFCKCASYNVNCNDLAGDCSRCMGDCVAALMISQEYPQTFQKLVCLGTMLIHTG